MYDCLIIDTTVQINARLIDTIVLRQDLLSIENITHVAAKNNTHVAQVNGKPVSFPSELSTAIEENFSKAHSVHFMGKMSSLLML